MAKLLPFKSSFYRKAVASVLFLALGWFMFMDTVWAHRVTIFAWVEGDTVHTQSKFSGGKRVMNSQVIVYDMERHQLLEGQTDNNGEFSFKLPPRSSSGLIIVLNSSMGHMAEWTIPAEEMPGKKSEDGSSKPSPSGSLSQEPSSASAPLSAENSAPFDGEYNCQHIQEMIDRSLDKKLSPIMDILIESLDAKPSLTDVIGGIGYIIGLVGLAMYFMARKKEP